MGNGSSQGCCRDALGIGTEARTVMPIDNYRTALHCVAAPVSVLWDWYRKADCVMVGGLCTTCLYC